jgi:hypothetical protein
MMRFVLFVALALALPGAAHPQWQQPAPPQSAWQPYSQPVP